MKSKNEGVAKGVEVEYSDDLLSMAIDGLKQEIQEQDDAEQQKQQSAEMDALIKGIFSADQSHTGEGKGLSRS